MARRKKNNEEEEQQNENVNDAADDTFGLPEIEYEPLKREPEPVIIEQTVYNEVPPAPEPDYQAEEEEEIERRREEEYVPPFNDDDEEEGSAWPRILGIGALLLIIGAGVWYYFGIYKPKHDAELARQNQEQIDRQTADAKKEADRLAAEQRLADERRKADSLATAKPTIGTVEALSGRTGRYYVVVASGIDDDLINDYANRLKDKGVSSKIIPPFGKTKFYRLAIAEGDTYDNAQATADALKGGEYADAVWVVKY